MKKLFLITLIIVTVLAMTSCQVIDKPTTSDEINATTGESPKDSQTDLTKPTDTAEVGTTPTAPPVTLPPVTDNRVIEYTVHHFWFKQSCLIFRMMDV